LNHSNVIAVTGHVYWYYKTRYEVDFFVSSYVLTPGTHWENILRLFMKPL